MCSRHIIKMQWQRRTYLQCHNRSVYAALLKSILQIVISSSLLSCLHTTLFYKHYIISVTFYFYNAFLCIHFPLCLISWLTRHPAIRIHSLRSHQLQFKVIYFKFHEHAQFCLPISLQMARMSNARETLKYCSPSQFPTAKSLL